MNIFFWIGIIGTLAIITVVIFLINPSFLYDIVDDIIEGLGTIPGLTITFMVIFSSPEPTNLVVGIFCAMGGAIVTGFLFVLYSIFIYLPFMRWFDKWFDKLLEKTTGDIIK